MTPRFLALALLALFALAATAAAAQEVIVGGWTEAHDLPTDEELQIVARFVAAHIAESRGSDAQLLKAWRAQTQVVAGLKVRMLLEVIEDDLPQLYEAVVWRQLDGHHEMLAWEHRLPPPCDDPPCDYALIDFTLNPACVW
jgi:hypothetical protein